MDILSSLHISNFENMNYELLYNVITIFEQTQSYHLLDPNIVNIRQSP